MWLEELENLDLKFDCFAGDSLNKLSASYLTSLNRSEDQLIEEISDGCPLLHLACLTADNGMVELLLQYGANINASDSKGHTALHYCIISKRYPIAKLLLRRQFFLFSSPCFSCPNQQNFVDHLVLEKDLSHLPYALLLTW